IRLKGGRKLYGVIVAYEDNMFKVKTEYGYELIEKDKIESIIPSTPAGKSESATAKKDGAQHPAKPAGDSQPQAEPAVATSADAGTAASNASAKTINSGSAGKTDKASPKITSNECCCEAGSSSEYHSEQCRGSGNQGGSSRDDKWSDNGCDGTCDSARASERAASSGKPRRDPGQSLHKLHSRIPHVQGAELELD
ncbi:MAG: hypothetical protein DMG45_21645, partial [Acidobacteria bacterium]